jgi:CheY-like chemotaxis protein
MNDLRGKSVYLASYKSDLETLTLYIVEDDPIQSLMLERMAENLGLNVIGSADNGTDAIHDILAYEPDLILMDIQLRCDTSGIDVAKAILTSCRPGIIFITANSDMREDTRLSELPSHHFLAKPVSYHELQQTIAGMQLTQM